MDEDQYAISWKDHQVQRIERIKKIGAQMQNVPEDCIKIGFQCRHYLELFDRDGRYVRYRPEGVILHQHQNRDDIGMMVFDVAWVDPWGYPHTGERTFLELVIKPLVEIDYMRGMKEYRKAVDVHWVETQDEG